MIYSLAPMEGITGCTFRRVHAECFGALDRYYTPFLAPPRVGNSFGGKAFKEIEPANNEGLNVIPQLLTKNADEFVWAARELAELGYAEVNLNLGCPSGTVVSKGKGSGFLRNLDELEVFLRDVCDRSPLPVSVKTRLGLESDAEYERILELYCSLPLAELIVHPRVQKDRYQGKPRWEPYGETLARAPFPVAYNGDIFGTEDMDALMEAHPRTRHVMLGRGLLADPALARMLAGGPAASADESACAEGSLPGQTALGAIWRDARACALPGGLQRRHLWHGGHGCAHGGAPADPSRDARPRVARRSGSRAHARRRPSCERGRTQAVPRQTVCRLSRRDRWQCGLPHEGVVVLRQVISTRSAAMRSSA